MSEKLKKLTENPPGAGPSSPDGLHDRVRIQFLSHPRTSGMARDFVGSVARRHGLDRDTVSDLRILAGEAVSNIFRHSYSGRSGLPILTEIKVYSHYFELQFRDFGKKTDPSQIVKKELSDYRTNGLGVYLISRLSDFHVFSTDPEKGNILTIKKRISGL